MISAICFDLDGTLVDTETLKAWSYARAAAERRAGGVREDEVLAAYTAYAGLDRTAIAASLLARLGIERAESVVRSALAVHGATF
ncbi:MAG TPA: HAD family hydrolase [Gemmatimonadaceae bacterium]|nr:HAD family hydrolase [Gemmatimonadaceae bacterium]